MNGRYTTSLWLNRFCILIFCAMIGGAYEQQFFQHEMPCALCLLIRIAMLLVALGAIMNLRIGIAAKHYAYCMFGVLLGGAVSIRMITMHICPSFKGFFGIPMWGMNLFTWAFFAFVATLIGITILLMLYDSSFAGRKNNSKFWDWFCLVVLLVVSFANIFTASAVCGIGLCPR